VLRAADIPFSEHTYRYEDHGGAARGAGELGIDEHTVIKTLVMEDDTGRPFIVLMHGDREVSTKNLARTIGAKRVEPCSPERAEKLTGYQVGGTSPFGTRTPLSVYVEESILGLERIYINGGRRGFLVGISPPAIVRVLDARAVRVAI